MFDLLRETGLGRRGNLKTAHGVIETPFFMPVATCGAMRGITHADLLTLGAQILLCNTYHLSLRPGVDVVEKAGGTMQNIVKTTIYLKDMDDFAKVNEIYKRYFPSEPPARATVQVSRLPKDVGIEIDAIVNIKE